LNILNQIKEAKVNGEKLLAILVDPDKVGNEAKLVAHLTASPPNYIFVGGSRLETAAFKSVIKVLHEAKICPVIIFPGDQEQISDDSDAILLLSLISGRNPEYLIGQHVAAAQRLSKYKGEIIPTSYILIDGNKNTSVQQVSQTKPISQMDSELIINTILAGKFLGHQLHYLEAGSGANSSVSPEIVNQVSSVTPHPIIVGGGIRTAKSANEIWSSGADLIVVGNGFEERGELLKDIKSIQGNS
jgi:putative glycerol-1-phosphate prenyltransferase